MHIFQLPLNQWPGECRDVSWSELFSLRTTAIQCEAIFWIRSGSWAHHLIYLYPGLDWETDECGSCEFHNGGSWISTGMKGKFQFFQIQRLSIVITLRFWSMAMLAWQSPLMHWDSGKPSCHQERMRSCYRGSPISDRRHSFNNIILKLQEHEFGIIFQADVTLSSTVVTIDCYTSVSEKKLIVGTSEKRVSKDFFFQTPPLSWQKYRVQASCSSAYSTMSVQ